MAKKKPKYIRGERITSLEEFLTQIDSNRFVFLHTRPKHPAFLIGMPLRTIRNLVKDKRDDTGFFYAIDSTKPHLFARIRQLFGLY